MWTIEATGAADAAEAWDRYARPSRWPEWAPHLRGAWGLGDPVRPGARGVVRVAGLVPVPVRILAVHPPRAWSWRVGLVTMTHRVQPDPAGCRVRWSPRPAALAAAYAPLARIALERLARAAG